MRHSLKPAERIRVLSEAGELLASSLDFETTLSSLAKLCVPRFADWCAIDIVGEDGAIEQLAVAHVDPARVEMARDLRSRFPPDPNSPRGVHHVVRTGEIEHVEEIPDALISQVARGPEHERMLRALGLRSYIIVPLALRGRVLGALSLVSAESGRHYEQSDVDFARELATRAAQAIENARLYRAAQRAQREAEAAVEHMGLLSRMTELLAASLEPEDALRHLAHFVVASLADYCVAYRLERDGTLTRVALAHAEPARQPLVEALVRAGPPTIDDANGAGAVVRTNEPVLASDIPPAFLEQAVQNDRHLEVVRELGPRSSIIVPLTARGRTLGALALATTDRSGRRYQQADVAVVQEVASRAAMLIDNARLYGRAREATSARDQMLSIVSHDLRSPLTAIMTGCDLLALDPPPERRAKTLDSIRRAAEQMNRLVEDLLDVTRIHEGKLTLRHDSVDAEALLGELASLHGPVAEDREVRLVTRVDDSIAFDGDRNRLIQAMSNLVGNALKFTPKGGQIIIEAERHGDRVSLSVHDSGPGIPADQIPHLFDRFWRADERKTRGVGLGLAITKGIAEAHGGSVQVSSEPGDGARFSLVVPVARPQTPAR